MCDEILYLILFIIIIFIINKICKIKIKLLIIFIIIIIFFIFIIYNISKNNNIELFNTNVSDMCNMVKNRLNDLISKESKKCVKNYEEIKENRKEINDGIDCYNLVGNEIITNNNIDSWCNLNDIDVDIINNAVKKLN